MPLRFCMLYKIPRLFVSRINNLTSPDVRCSEFCIFLELLSPWYNILLLKTSESIYCSDCKYASCWALLHCIFCSRWVVMNRVSIWTPSRMMTTVTITPLCCSIQREMLPRQPPRKITLWAENSSSCCAPTPHWVFHTVPFSRGSIQHEGGTPHAWTPGAEQLKYLCQRNGYRWDTLRCVCNIWHHPCLVPGSSSVRFVIAKG